VSVKIISTSTSLLPTLSPHTADCVSPPPVEEFDGVVSEDEGRGMSVVRILEMVLLLLLVSILVLVLLLRLEWSSVRGSVG